MSPICQPFFTPKGVWNKVGSADALETISPSISTLEMTASPAGEKYFQI